MSLFNVVATNVGTFPVGSFPSKDKAPPRTVAKANRKDCDQIFELVNLAFKCEIGKTGISYKKCDKYRLKDSARKHLDDMWVVKENRKVRNFSACILFF